MDKDAEQSSKEVTSDNVNKVKKLIYQRMLVEIKDGRSFTGNFHCIDKQGNIILQDATEHRSSRGRPDSPADKRFIGLVLIPCSCRVSCHVDCSQQLSIL